MSYYENSHNLHIKIFQISYYGVYLNYFNKFLGLNK